MRDLPFPGLALAALIGLLTLATPSSATVRTDVVDENYLTGFFTWKDGKTGISWDPNRDSSDDANTDNNTAGLVDEFISDPLPRTIYLNASRVIHVDVFSKTTWLPNYKVELYVGREFLAGGQGEAQSIRYCSGTAKTSCADPSLKPETPGYQVTPTRMQAELDTIPKDSIIRVRVIHGGNNVVAAYGLAGEHASVLRLPVFSSDEVLYRVPKYSLAGGHENSPVPPLDPTAQLLNQVLHPQLAALGLPLLIQLRRRGPRRSAVLALAVLTGSFAGCASPSPQSQFGVAPADPELAGTANVYLVRDEDNDTGLVDANRGSLYGVVSDSENLPVNGAYVALIGTAYAGRTDPYGRFHFTGLLPGRFHLRVDRDGFKAFEETVNVEASTITKIEITLEFVNPEAVNQRPHRHDEWGGKNSIIIIDQPMPRALTGVFSILYLPPPTIILPGTADIEINLTWNGGGTTRLYLYRPDDVPGPSGNETPMYPRASGIPFHLRTTWEMTDPGHSNYTFWGVVRAWFPSKGTCPSDPVEKATFLRYDCATDAGNPRIKITLHRGIVPLEPAHPDLWRGRSAVAVLTNETGTMHSSYGTWGRALAFQTIPNVTWQPSEFVPAETAWLEVILVATHNEWDDPPLSDGAPWRLFYGDANTPNYGDCTPGAPQNEFTSKLAQLTTKDSVTRTWSWRISLEPGQADPPYAKRPNWCFFVSRNDPLSVAAEFGVYAIPDLLLSVTAHQDRVPN